MIISASRRTDIPAFYAPWFMNRIRAGFCHVPNPFNRNQVSRVALRPQDVDVIVFWTRNPHPIFSGLNELDSLGYRYYFQFTIMDNPRSVDSKSPPAEAAISAFKALSDRLGSERVIWRYDPIVLSPVTDADYHRLRFDRIAKQLHGYTTRSVISIMDVYKKAERRLQALAMQGVTLPPHPIVQWPGYSELLEDIADMAVRHGMEIVSCAEDLDLTGYGILPGKCIDDGLIERVFGLRPSVKKDPSQRSACGCVVSRDIGMYDSCLFGCQYCYATSSFDRAAINHAEHDIESPSLIGHYEASASPISTSGHPEHGDDSCSATQLSLLP